MSDFNSDLTEGEDAAQRRQRQRAADDELRERIGHLYTNLPKVEYPVDKQSTIRFSAAVSLSGSGIKLRGVGVEYRKIF